MVQTRSVLYVRLRIKPDARYTVPRGRMHELHRKLLNLDPPLNKNDITTTCMISFSAVTWSILPQIVFNTSNPQCHLRSSVRSLLPPTINATPTPETSEITPEKLRHLLRLAALPPPVSEVEEADLIKTLLDQLHFVRDTQSVDTSGIEPLAVTRDEVSVREYSIQDIAPEAEKEVGKQGSVEWDALSLAERKLGSYLVVDEAPEEGWVERLEGKAETVVDLE